MNRRDFIEKVGGISVACTTSGLSLFSGSSIAKSRAKVVIVGGGYGGATVATTLRRLDPTIEITLIEANRFYYSAYMNNLVISGVRSESFIKNGYDNLADAGVNIVIDKVVDIQDRYVRTQSGEKYWFDRCIVSPGIDFSWVEGHGPNSSVTHAYKAGRQAKILHRQLRSMRDGGIVIVSAPRNPFSCPPAPYERVSQIAYYLKKNKPRSKIIILDPKDKFSMYGLYMEGWKMHYGYGSSDSLITWVRGGQGGALEAVHASTNTAVAALDEFRADVLNVIPDQKAGKLAFRTGLVNGHWCPINMTTFESVFRNKVYVIGDAALAKGLPKTAGTASSQAKVCALSVVTSLQEKDLLAPSFSQVCYALITPTDGVSVGTTYGYDSSRKKAQRTSGGLTPSGQYRRNRDRELEAENAIIQYKTIVKNSFLTDI